ncbi:MAG TPA: hypothetical protein VEB21_04220 [Terriglobales bacterium]|nr:hypothetical protein [Terriglobales bacterium]
MIRPAIGLLVLVLLLAGCSIGRTYSGVPLRGDPQRLVEGRSTRTEVLAELGPPEAIIHQTSGDAFVYRYRQINSSSLTINDPFFLRQPVFSYSREHRASDTLVVLFDFHGTVRSIVRDRDTEELPFL